MNGKFKSNDQDYLNKISKHFNWKFLDVELFPNGCYYYDHHKKGGRLHCSFNFVKYKEKEGEELLQIMVFIDIFRFKYDIYIMEESTLDLVVVGSGGNGQTYFMEFLHQSGVNMNSPHGVMV